MDIPIGPSVGSTTSTTPSGIPPSSTGSPTVTFDSLSISPQLLDSLQLQNTGIQLPSGGISLRDWFKTITDSHRALQEVLKEIYTSDPLNDQDAARGNIGIADVIAAEIDQLLGQVTSNAILLDQMQKAEQDVKDAAQQLVSSSNNLNAVYNAISFSDPWGIMNTAASDVQTAANAVPFDQSAYDSAVRHYNDEVTVFYDIFVTTLNGQFIDPYNNDLAAYSESIDGLNSVIDQKNAKIDALNQERAAQGLPLLAREPNVTATLPPQADDARGLSTITNTPPPPSNMFVTPPAIQSISFTPATIPITPSTTDELTTIQAQVTVLVAVLANLVLSQSQIRAIEDNLAKNILFIQAGRGDLAINDFITQVKQSLTGPGTTSISSLVSGLSSPSVEGILGQTLVQQSIANTLGSNQTDTQNLSENFSNLLSAFILTAVQLGISPSGSIGSNISVSIESRRFLNTFLVSLAFANQLVNLVTSETFRQQVASTVQKDPQLALLLNKEGFDPQVRNTLIDQLTKVGTISLLLLASAQLGQGTGATGLLLQPSIIASLLGVPSQAVNIGDLIQLVTKNLSPEEQQNLQQDLTNATTGSIAATGVPEADAKTKAEAFIAEFFAGQIPSSIPGLTAEQTAQLVQSTIVSAITSGIAKDAQLTAENAEDLRKTQDILETSLRGLLPDGSALVNNVLSAVGNPGSADELFAKIQGQLIAGLTGVPGGNELANQLTIQVLVVFQEAQVKNLLKAGIGGGPEINLLASEVVKTQNLITNGLQDTIRDLNLSILSVLPQAIYTFLDNALDPAKGILNDRLELGITYVNALQEATGSSNIAGLAQQEQKSEVEFKV